MPYERDPVSVQFDRAAARLLARAHRAGGQWAGTYVANPSREWQQWARRRGIDLLGPDNASTKSGQHQDARTRWCRAFVRSVYYQHKWFFYAADGPRPGDKRATANSGQALQFQVGTVRISPAGLVVGRAVRIRLLAGGARASAAAFIKPYDERIYDAGSAGARWADPAGRDW
jgi:hypothetical protein